MEKDTIKKTVKKSAKEVNKDEVSKLRIRVRAYDSKILDASVKQIIDTALRFDVKVLGPIPLPTEIKKYTVNRASFVYKNAREQFEMRVHKRLIDIISPSAKVVEALTNLSPASPFSHFLFYYSPHYFSLFHPASFYLMALLSLLRSIPPSKQLMSVEKMLS
jgi:small subunit ribosomal protein S10